MELKVIEGNRDELERKLLETIWLGTPEEAVFLISKFQALPQPDLRLVTDNTKEILTLPPLT
jgi:hypothetical protein